MACPDRPHRHYVAVRWGEILPSDLEPMGDPEWELHYRKEKHIGLHIRGQTGVTLGMLGIRCAVDAYGDLLPLGMAWADTASAILNLPPEPSQSNPRRAEDDNGHVE